MVSLGQLTFRCRGSGKDPSIMHAVAVTGLVTLGVCRTSWVGVERMKRPLIGHQRRSVVPFERWQTVHRRNLLHHRRNKSRRCLPVQSILGYTCSCILYGLRHYSCHRRCHSLFLGLLWCKHHRETWGCVAGVWSQHQETKWGAKRDFYAKIQQERTSTSYSDLHATPYSCVCLPLVCSVATSHRRRRNGRLSDN